MCMIVSKGVSKLEGIMVGASGTIGLSLIYNSKFSLTNPLVKENLPTVHTRKFSLKSFSLTSFPW